MTRLAGERTQAASKEPHVARHVIVLVGGSILPDLHMETGTYISVVNEVPCEHGHRRESTAAKCLKARLNEVPATARTSPKEAR